MRAIVGIICDIAPTGLDLRQAISLAPIPRKAKHEWSLVREHLWMEVAANIQERARQNTARAFRQGAA